VCVVELRTEPLWSRCLCSLSGMHIDWLTLAFTKLLATVPKDASKRTEMNSCSISFQWYACCFNPMHCLIHKKSRSMCPLVAMWQGAKSQSSRIFFKMKVANRGLSNPDSRKEREQFHSTLFVPKSTANALQRPICQSSVLV
jgi:hypothetical protein